ncbi:MAG TPA: hypothetical protein VFQ05_03375 [Candidatus Eisenbacteria bacterium]|nr:hypothetical protein [Candidatus Eisenbacteria bacterium]
MKGLVIVVVLVLSVAILIEVVAIGGAWLLHRQGKIADEIAWLEGLQPIMVWDRALEGQIDRLYRERVRAELDADRLDRAVHALRLARGRALSRGLKPDPDLTSLGIETFTRAADRVEAHGQLKGAADWDDSLFVFAVRAQEPHHRFAAVAAFVEGLDLRVRAGDPCGALSRVEWARRGLGGEIPGFQPNVEEDLLTQCRAARRNRRP